MFKVRQSNMSSESVMLERGKSEQIMRDVGYTTSVLSNSCNKSKAEILKLSLTEILSFQVGVIFHFVRSLTRCNKCHVFVRDSFFTANFFVFNLLGSRFAFSGN